eukprot:TRINITY_DN1600_c0_g1_i1.p1 TRINITY_DN1600_c0_g1~~TRINITY_DN1600_c0_g1_i1.p1  ORF type:complete len:411 (+),score=99.75 TRINITY_DN1600_c0_g1_i1:662-1894(+)
MDQTVEKIIRNFVENIRLYGFVPNGARVYYTSRSQPPLLVQMLGDYLEWKQGKGKKSTEWKDTKGSPLNEPADEALELLKDALPYIDIEYNFWMTKRSVPLRGRTGETLYLNVYNSMSELPRPESFREDVALSTHLPSDNSTEREKLFQNVIATTESGWDFSSRWLLNPSSLTTLETTTLLPVDLNSILYKNEILLAHFHELLGNTTQRDYYISKARLRATAIRQYLWDEENLIWRDYNLRTGSLKDTRFYSSSLTPLAMDLPHPDVPRFLQKYHQILFSYPSGIPVSTAKGRGGNYTGQQWDFPNVWAPHEFWFVKFLEQKNKEKRKDGVDYHLMAVHVAQHWIDTTLCGWNSTGYMFEKYDAEKLGFSGGGGEYLPQDGFGWTNGVVLRFLLDYGNELEVRYSCPSIS